VRLLPHIRTETVVSGGQIATCGLRCGDRSWKISSPAGMTRLRKIAVVVGQRCERAMSARPCPSRLAPDLQVASADLFRLGRNTASFNMKRCSATAWSYAERWLSSTIRTAAFRGCPSPSAPWAPRAGNTVFNQFADVGMCAIHSLIDCACRMPSRNVGARRFFRPRR
jgi:hypothetical protein